MAIDFESLTAKIRAFADDNDRTCAWPESALAAAAEFGVWRWCIATEYGGLGVDSETLLRGYEALGRGHLAIALIVTQRDGAAQLIQACDNGELRSRVLPQYAAGTRFVSVGISQLTTSKAANNKPHMTAAANGDDYAITGKMPWVTAAARCDDIVTGAVLADGRQLLACVPTDIDGLTVNEPMSLMALESSLTTSVACDNAAVTADQLLRPVQQEVLRQRAPTKSLTVASVGIGFAGGLFDAIADFGRGAADVDEHVAQLRERYDELHSRLFDYAARLGDEDFDVPKAEIRAEINDLINRTAIACLTVAKGTGYLASHRAQRLVREAMFFNVWSAPDDVRRMTLGHLTRDAGTVCER